MLAHNSSDRSRWWSNEEWKTVTAEVFSQNSSGRSPSVYPFCLSICLSISSDLYMEIVIKYWNKQIHHESRYKVASSFLAFECGLKSTPSWFPFLGNCAWSNWFKFEFMVWSHQYFVIRSELMGCKKHHTTWTENYKALEMIWCLSCRCSTSIWFCSQQNKH